MTTKHLRVTVIIPSLNRAPFLEQCILSVLDQQYPHTELIVIDGGSSDDSVPIIQRYAHRLAYWVSEQDAGQSEAINKGLARASGDVIHWLNTDDRLCGNALRVVAEGLSDPEIEVICGYAEISGLREKVRKRTTDLRSPTPGMVANMQIVQPSTFFRRQVFHEFGPLEPSLHYMMDHCLLLKYVGKKGPAGIAYTNEVLAGIGFHADAKSFKDHQAFERDFSRIYSSLFAAMNVRCLAFPLLQPEELLPFEVSYAPVKENAAEIDFNLMYGTLFGRDAFGKKQRLNIKSLAKLLRHYPLPLLRRMMSW